MSRGNPLPMGLPEMANRESPFAAACKTAQDLGNLAEEVRRFDPGLPLDDALTPPASWYTEPGFLDLERETVFRGSWQYAGRSSLLQRPGDFFTGNFLGRPYVALRDEAGEVRAYYNVCAHHAACVASGEGNTDRLVCPYHGWTYGLDGRLQKAPRAGAISRFAHKNLRLKPLPVHIWGPFVFVHFGGSADSSPFPLANSLDAFRPWFPAQPAFVKQVTYRLDCNWKVFVDNYLDGGYHVPHMHKALSAHLNLKSYASRLGELYSIQTCGGTDNEADSRVGDSAYYAWLYPNFMVNRYGRWLDTNWVVPLDHRSCLTVFDYYHDGPISDSEAVKALSDSDCVQQEDIQIAAMVQTGLGSGAYDQGVYAPRYEAPMYHFHRLLHRDLTGAVG